MPDNHKLYVEQTPENALQWAETIGENTLRLIQYLLDTYQVERKALSSIFSLKNSSRRYTKYEIERACKEILNVTQRPTVKLVQNQLKANKKKDAEQALEKPSKSQDDFGFTRGSDYWGGKGQ
jgi:arginine/lysine/ornithine decarboxylase